MLNTTPSDLQGIQDLLEDYFGELAKIDQEYQERVRGVFEKIRLRKLEEVRRKIKAHG